MKLLKKNIIIALVLVANGMNLFSQNIFSFSGSSIVTNSTYLDVLLSGVNDPTNQPFVTTGSVGNFYSSDHQYNYNVVLQKYNGWESEPGDFQIISIYNNTNLLLQLHNTNSWIKIPAALRQFTTNDYFIPVTLSNSSTALIFIGYKYPSQTPQLSIVVLSGNQAKLVFNQDYYIQQIINTGTTFSIILRDQIAQYTSESAATAATYIYAGNTYNISLANGVLNFAQQ